MAENKTQKFKKNHLFLKMTLQLLVSISVLSFFVSYSSDLSYFLHYYYYHVSAMLCPILSQILERKYMFLICNGIVAFLAKNFSFTSYSPSGPNIIDTFVKSEHGLMPVHKVEEPLERKEPATIRLCRALITETDDDKDDSEKVSGCSVPPFSEEAGGDEENMSTDELNRRFDEFIRKMKEEIRIGARLQPIAV